MTPEDFTELRYLLHWAWRRSRSEFKHVRILAQCTGKHAFDNRKAAEDTLSVKLKRLVHAFRCKTCKKWHLGEGEVDRKKRIILKRRRGNDE